MNHLSRSVFHIVSKCTKTELTGYWSQLYNLSLLGLSLSGWVARISPSPFLSKSKWSTVCAFQSIWKPHSDIRTVSLVGENTQEPQMAQEHTTGPSFNISVLPHWVLFPSHNAAKYLETFAPGRRLLLSSCYSGDQDPNFSFI